MNTPVTEPVTDTQLAQIIQAVEGRSTERVQRVSGWVPAAITILTLLVGTTAYLAPMRDDIDRVELAQAQYEQDGFQQRLRLAERIDGVEDKIDSSTQETAARLAAIQADVSVIKARIDGQPQ